MRYAILFLLSTLFIMAYHINYRYMIAENRVMGLLPYPEERIETVCAEPTNTIITIPTPVPITINTPINDDINTLGTLINDAKKDTTITINKDTIVDIKPINTTKTNIIKLDVLEEIPIIDDTKEVINTVVEPINTPITVVNDTINTPIIEPVEEIIIAPVQQNSTITVYVYDTDIRIDGRLKSGTATIIVKNVGRKEHKISLGGVFKIGNIGILESGEEVIKTVKIDDGAGLVISQNKDNDKMVTKVIATK